MRKLVLSSLVALGLATSMCSSDKSPVKAGDLNTLQDSVSYIIGNNIGTQMHQQKLDLNLDVFVRAFHSAFQGEESMIDRSEVQKVMTAFQMEMQKKMEAERTEKKKLNKEEGDAFLAKNKDAEGVKVTESGLQYKVIKEGTGAVPAETDKVKVHYHGTLIDGTVFDSSVDRGEPISFAVNGVIAGWTEALKMMPVGSKWKLFIPSELAYGERGAGKDIGPNATLIFEVELLDIEK